LDSKEKEKKEWEFYKYIGEFIFEEKKISQHKIA